LEWNDGKHYLNTSSNKTVTLNWDLPRLLRGQTLPYFAGRGTTEQHGIN